MNILKRGASLLASTTSTLLKRNAFVSPQILNTSFPLLTSFGGISGKLNLLTREASSLFQMHIKGPHIKNRPNKSPLGGNPFLKGVVLKTLIKKPKKPNSANRKCVLVKLSNGKEMIAYVPGEGHNLQEHSIVLCRGGKLKDTPGVKIKCVRGAYDLPHVVKPVKA